MECNKDEAKRAMDIAEKKLSDNDYVGAKKFVDKAQNLYPQLDGLKQVLVMVDVYISAASKISGVGEADWYGVLGVDPLADDEALKRQYKKLALLLHPDKNKCKGAEGAFKLVSEAWCLLSDKVKRIAYDQRKLKPGTQKPPNQHKPASSNGNQNEKQGVHPSAKARSNQPANGTQKPPNAHKPASSSGNQNARDGVHPSANARNNQPASWPQKPPNAYKPASSSGNQNEKQGVHPSAKARSNQPASGTQKPPDTHKPASASGNQNEKQGVHPSDKARSNPLAPVNSSKGSTFWTMCNGCKTRYEYRTDYYLNKAILCPNCGQTFIATENHPWASYVRQANFRIISCSKITTGNRNSTFEAERLFKKPMTTGNPNSTPEAERLFKKPMTTGNPNSTFEAERLFKNHVK